jgi:quinolinate synthase
VVPPEADPVNVPAEEHRVLLAEIARLKKEMNAYILPHNYAPPYAMASTKLPSTPSWRLARVYRSNEC